jgi:cyclopropane fatty-acyl-phospholipid synthase-like methyltransferase
VFYFCGALKNILLAALANQFSPLVYHRDYFFTAKIVSPPRGTIMLFDITRAEARQRVLCRKRKERVSNQVYPLQMAKGLRKAAP